MLGTIVWCFPDLFPMLPSSPNVHPLFEIFLQCPVMFSWHCPTLPLSWMSLQHLPMTWIYIYIYIYIYIFQGLSAFCECYSTCLTSSYHPQCLWDSTWCFLGVVWWHPIIPQCHPSIQPFAWIFFLTPMTSSCHPRYVWPSSHCFCCLPSLPLLSSFEIEQHIFKPKKIPPNLKITQDTLFGTSLRLKNILRKQDIPHRSQRYPWDVPREKKKRKKKGCWQTCEIPRTI